jgi:hypothetical protein
VDYPLAGVQLAGEAVADIAATGDQQAGMLHGGGS